MSEEARSCKADIKLEYSKERSVKGAQKNIQINNGPLFPNLMKIMIPQI